MPNRDGTGPQGQGQMTGRGYGPCGRGYGFRGRGWHYGPYYQASLSPKEEKDVLEDEVKNLEHELKAVKDRLAELES